jgi:signal transduction histidine kinase
MRSIRASLIAYFWLLLALGLGTASVLAYRTAAASLREKQQVNRQLLETQFHDREMEEKNRFDERLFTTASMVATHVEVLPISRTRIAQALMPIGMMSESQAYLVNAWTAPPLPFTRSTSSLLPPLFSQAVRDRLNTDVIKLDESKLPRDELDVEFFQVDTNTDLHWQPSHVGSRSLFPTHAFDPARGTEFVFDDVTLPNGNPGRRVQFKSGVRVRLFFPSRRNPGRPAPGPTGDRPPPGGERGLAGGDRTSPGADRQTVGATSPWIVVHCASETTRRDEEIAKLQKALTQELDNVERRGQESLSQLRQHLLTISLITFLLTTIGGYVLVGLGLIPLRRMTDAVSQISTRDFRLPLAADELLPKELAPIRDRLQETLDELRKAFEREKQAAADISHELRTPVASMLTAVEVALRKPRTADEYRHTLEDCRGVARQMRHLVERLMALARLDAGSDKLRPRPVDVAELVHECASLIKPLAGERGLDVRVHCPKPVVWTTDPDKLREVLVNLLHNAVQYNRQDGSIDVSAHSADGWLDVQVHDTGPGIPKDAFAHIFERFYRADPSRHASELHAGLGLSIVKGYVGLLGGTITVDSQVGQGSTFRVRLPNGAAAAA